MALHKLKRRNYGRMLLVSIKYQILHSFIEGVIHLCQSILETRRISRSHGSALFTIPLSCFTVILIGIHKNVDICQNDYSLQTKNFWTYNIQVNERLEKIKEK